MNEQEKIQQLKSRVQTGPVGQFFAWWIEELRLALPETWQRKLQHAMRRVALQYRDGALVLLADENRRLTDLDDLSASLDTRVQRQQAEDLLERNDLECLRSGQLGDLARHQSLDLDVLDLAPFEVAQPGTDGVGERSGRRHVDEGHVDAESGHEEDQTLWNRQRPDVVRSRGPGDADLQAPGVAEPLADRDVVGEDLARVVDVVLHRDHRDLRMLGNFAEVCIPDPVEAIANRDGFTHPREHLGRVLWRLAVRQLHLVGGQVVVRLEVAMQFGVGGRLFRPGRLGPMMAGRTKGDQVVESVCDLVIPIFARDIPKLPERLDVVDVVRPCFPLWRPALGAGVVLEIDGLTGGLAGKGAHGGWNPYGGE